MLDSTDLATAIMNKQAEDESELFSGLFQTLREAHAVGRDPVRGGEQAFYAFVERIQTKLCESATVTMIRKDFNQSGPVVAALLLGDQFFVNLGHSTVVYLGALIVKLGVDRLCDQNF